MRATAAEGTLLEVAGVGAVTCEGVEGALATEEDDFLVVTGVEGGGALPNAVTFFLDSPIDEIEFKAEGGLLAPVGRLAAEEGGLIVLGAANRDEGRTVVLASTVADTLREVEGAGVD